HPTAAALAHARSTFARIPNGRAVVIDGLALGGLAPLLEAEANRLRLIALVHHPLAAETGLDRAASEALRRAEQDSLAAVERTLVTSGWTARALLSDYGLDAERIRVVEPGTDPVPELALSSGGGMADREFTGPADRPAAPLGFLC